MTQYLNLRFNVKGALYATTICWNEVLLYRATVFVCIMTAFHTFCSGLTIARYLYRHKNI